MSFRLFSKRLPLLCVNGTLLRYMLRYDVNSQSHGQINTRIWQSYFTQILAIMIRYAVYLFVNYYSHTLPELYPINYVLVIQWSLKRKCIRVQLTYCFGKSYNTILKRALF